MYNFEIKIPTEIYYSIDAEEKVGILMKRFGKKVLLVYGSERIFKSGFGNKIVKNLKSAGCNVILCEGVKPNSGTSYINNAIKIARKENIDCILAIGGGSVIDSSKAISIGTYNDAEIVDVYKKDISPRKYLPIGVIVTMPATASESNGMSVISDSKTHEKIAYFNENFKPKFALLNPKLTLTVSPYQTASGGFDIFSHAFERYFDLTRNSQLLDSMTLGLMKTVINVLPIGVNTPTDLNAKSELMLAATIAHNNMLGPGGDFACHEMSHILTQRYGIAHGNALAMIIPIWCKYMYKYNPERFNKFYKEIWNVDAKNGYIKLAEFINSINLPTTINTDIDETDHLAQITVSHRFYIGSKFKKMTKQDVKAIYSEILLQNPCN